MEDIIMAKNFRESDYAINKGKQGVVYRMPNNQLLEITFEICLKDDPTLTREKFEEIKMYSDENYHEVANMESLQKHYEIMALDVNRDTEVLAAPSVEDILFHEPKKKITISYVKKAAMQILPEIQKRRFLMWLKGLKYREIAEIDGVSTTAIGNSIEKSIKNINKFFEKGVEKR